jgi:hypothetical protein
MFDSLNDQMKHDLEATESSRQRALKWLAVTVFSVVVFGGLYIAVRLVE